MVYFTFIFKEYHGYIYLQCILSTPQHRISDHDGVKVIDILLTRDNQRKLHGMRFYALPPMNLLDGISGIKSLLDHKYRTLIEDKFISF